MEKVAQSKHNERDRAETLEWTGESLGNLKRYHFHVVTDLVPIIILQFSAGVTPRSVILCRSTSSSLRLLTLRSLLPPMAPSRGSDPRFIQVHTGHWCRSLADMRLATSPRDPEVADTPLYLLHTNVSRWLLGGQLR